MSDVYATLSDAETAVVEQIAERLELRAADPKQRAMLHTYLSELSIPDDAKVLEVGCGSGAVARVLARWPGVGHVQGIDPTRQLVECARQLAHGIANLSFEVGDGRDLRLPSEAYDVVVFHTSLCHIPEPERALREAHRMLRPGGRLAIFDGDYVTTTVAIGPDDPLQACVDMAMRVLVHDAWIVRRLPALVRAAGFDVWDFRGHAYVQSSDAAYMLSLVELGADMLVKEGHIAAELGSALKADACRRATNGSFFGEIVYASLLARKSHGEPWSDTAG